MSFLCILNRKRIKVLPATTKANLVISDANASERALLSYRCSLGFPVGQTPNCLIQASLANGCQNR